MNRKIILEPPDGGWGWMICFAHALSNFIYIPILQNFGLIFKNSFPLYGINATDGSVIINLNSAFGMMMGLINGTLLNKFGYRKVAVMGGVCIFIGLISTAYATTFEEFIITYGLLTSLGFGLALSAFSLAINTFFKTKRGLAHGYAMTATGLGPILMPLFVSYLLQEYDIRGTVLIIGGLSLNSLVAAALLQPIKWHWKKKQADDIVIDDSEETKVNLLESDNLKNRILESRMEERLNKNKVGLSTLSINHDTETQSIYGFETPLPMRRTSVTSNAYDNGITKMNFIRSISHQEKRLSSSLMSSKSSVYCSAETDLHKSMTMLEGVKEHDEEPEKEDNPPHGCMQAFVKLFDLTLLTDPIYLNLMIGMSIAICAEINFSLFTPFILNDMKFSTFQIAKIMSLLATIDIIFRFLAPFIARKFNLSARIMYMFSLSLLICSRTSLIFVKRFYEALAVACFLGIAKGFRTVYMSLLIPNYVPLERLAAASGIQMVANGIIVMINAPIIGKIRDITGSYNKCIIVMNSLTFCTIFMWTVEILYMKYRNKKISNVQ